jgi:excisionase family DNA binding protein
MRGYINNWYEDLEDFLSPLLMEKLWRNVMTEEKRLEIPFWNKLNLTIKEAAAYSGIGETTIRKMLSERGCSFLFKVETKNLIKRKEFEKYLDGVHYL